MHIYQLGADNEVDRDMPTYAIEAMEVYPAYNRSSRICIWQNK